MPKAPPLKFVFNTALLIKILLVPGWGVLQQKGSVISAKDGERVLGVGNACSLSSYPYMVNILMSNDLSSLCAGTLLSGEWVMTATHCFENEENPQWFLVVAGVPDADPNANGIAMQSSTVSAIFLHPNYDNVTMIHDVALLKTSATFNRTDFVQFVQLPSADTYYAEVGTIYNSCVVIGWGTSRARRRLIPKPHSITTSKTLPNNPSSERLQRPQRKRHNYELRCSRLTILDSSNCSEAVQGANLLQYTCARFLKAENQADREGCPMDTGGPLVCGTGNGTGTVFGVTTIKIKCRGVVRSEPVPLTRIDTHLGYIDEVMALSEGYIRDSKQSKALDKYRAIYAQGVDGGAQRRFGNDWFLTCVLTFCTRILAFCLWDVFFYNIT